MKLSLYTISLLQKHISIPLVGLINKETYEIVLAPCITPKVFLDIDNTGKARSGYFMKDNFELIRNCSEEELQHFNLLLKQHYVPRLADTPSKDEMSAHEFLFQQHCGATAKSAWGGFAVTLESSGKLIYSFESGAFNTPVGQKRIKGAKLADIYKNKIISQFNDYMQEHYPESEATQDHSEKKVSELKVPEISNVSKLLLIPNRPMATFKRPTRDEAALESENENHKESRVSRRLF